MVIRLEALTDEGRAESRSIDAVEVGGEVPLWVQSQTTYARLHVGRGGRCGLKVVVCEHRGCDDVRQEEAQAPLSLHLHHLLVHIPAHSRVTDGSANVTWGENNMPHRMSQRLVPTSFWPLPQLEESSGVWTASNVTQKIWVKGSIYELQVRTPLLISFAHNLGRELRKLYFIDTSGNLRDGAGAAGRSRRRRGQQQCRR